MRLFGSAYMRSLVVRTVTCLQVFQVRSSGTGVIKALLPQCVGQLPWQWHGDGWRGVAVIKQLLASGSEVALLNTPLPHLSPNTTAHFKVSCLCGAGSSQAQFLFGPSCFVWWYLWV